MKLTALLLLTFTLNVSAKGFGQDKISLKVRNTEISGVLHTIEKQTNYRFLYNDNLQDIREKVTINVREATLDEVLHLLLEKTSLLYQKMDNNLVVIKEDPGVLNRVPDVVIRGKVLGEGGMALAGASIQIKGSTTGTSTDNDGNFSLTAPDANVTLVVSSVGYDPQEIALGGRTEITVTLVTSTKVMDQVVVIGYGTASRRDLTGSIVKVSGKEVADKPNTNPVASLQGKVSGLSIVNSGVPGQEPDIRIRGTISRYQTKPLYVVDGIFNDNINFLNPADIESMEVLKDPSSLAIFGVRGANGVIIVTTKKGRAGQLLVNVNSSIGIKKIVNKPELTDAAGFKTLYDEQRANQGDTPYGDYALFQGNSDWIDLIANDNAIINTNNISVSSGTDRNKFYMGIGYTYEEGLINYERLHKIMLTLNDELKVSKNIKLGFSFNGYRANLPQLHNFSGALIATPIVEPFNTTHGVYNKLPELIGGPQIGNPLMGVEGTKNTNLAREYRAVGNVYAEVSFLRHFTLRANLLADLGFNNSRAYRPKINVYAAEIDTLAPQVGFEQTGVTQNENTYSKFQQDYLLTFKKDFGDHGLSVLGGFTTYYEGFNSLTGTVTQFTNRDPIPNDKRWWYVGVSPFGDPATRTSNSDQWERTTVSTLFRVLYNYKNKYLLNGSFRRDGSSEISPSARFDNFWAVGAAWEMTKEDFMADQNVFNDVKIKASIGKLGNQYNGVHYPYYPNYVPGATAVFGNTIVPAYVLAYRNDSTLRWEYVNSKEIGVEFTTLNNRLRGEFNFYHKETNDLLTYVETGSESFYINSGIIQNKGIELSATWSDKLSNGISYSIGGNFTTLNNKVVEVFTEGFTIIEGPSRTIAGYPIGHFFGYIHDGIYQSNADKTANPDASGLYSKYGPGDIKFRDLNGDNIIDVNDRAVIGNPTPDFIYGISLSGSFKGLEIGIDLQGVYGNEIWRSWGNGNSFAQFNYRSDRLGRWNGPETSNWEPRVSDLAVINSQNSTYMIEDGSYFRIRNVQIGYNFNTSFLSRLNIKSFKVFVNGQNLKTWKRSSGFTTEAGGSATSFGIDSGGYPLPSITSFGINVTF